MHTLLGKNTLLKYTNTEVSYSSIDMKKKEQGRLPSETRFIILDQDYSDVLTKGVCIAVQSLSSANLTCLKKGHFYLVLAGADLKIGFWDGKREQGQVLLRSRQGTEKINLTAISYIWRGAKVAKREIV